MHILKKLSPLALALFTTACVGLDGVAIGGLNDVPAGKLGKFTCDNGYKVKINYLSDERIAIGFNNGKDNFIVKANRAPSASGVFYIGEPNTVKWHEKGDSAIFNFPDNNYRDNGKILEATCKKG